MMSVVNVRKRFELRGRNPIDLEWRIKLLRVALQTRGGVVLDIERTREDAPRPYAASVFYQLPLVHAEVATS